MRRRLLVRGVVQGAGFRPFVWGLAMRLEPADSVCNTSGEEIVVRAERVAASFGAGGRLFACGNGGSATSAADLASELLHPHAPHQPLPALCLTNNVAVVSAVANDVSFDDVVARSSSVHRIQEVQTTLYRLLIELVQRSMEGRVCA